MNVLTPNNKPGNGRVDGAGNLLVANAPLSGANSAGYRSQITVTRPANATPYAAGDVVGGVIEFTSVGPDGGHVVIMSADLRIDVAALPSGMGSFRLHLYGQTPPSALADNAPWDLTAADRAVYSGYVDIGAPGDFGSTLYVQSDNVNKPTKLATGSTSLFGYLVSTGAFTPAGNSEAYVPRLRTVAL